MREAWWCFSRRDMGSCNLSEGKRMTVYFGRLLGPGCTRRSGLPVAGRYSPVREAALSTLVTSETPLAQLRSDSPDCGGSGGNDLSLRHYQVTGATHGDVSSFARSWPGAASARCLSMMRRATAGVDRRSAAALGRGGWPAARSEGDDSPYSGLARRHLLIGGHDGQRV